MAGELTNSPRRSAPNRGDRVAKIGLVCLFSTNLIILSLFAAAVFLPPYLGMEEDWVGHFDAAAPENAALSITVAVGSMATLLIQFIGVGMVLWALFALKVRRRWFYWWMQLATVSALLASPGGLVLAIVVGRYLYYNRAEFFDRSPLGPPPVPVATQGATASSAGKQGTNVAVSRHSSVLEEENRQLKAIVAEQAMEIQYLKESSMRQSETLDASTR